MLLSCSSSLDSIVTISLFTPTNRVSDNAITTLNYISEYWLINTLLVISVQLYVDSEACTCIEYWSYTLSHHVPVVECAVTYRLYKNVLN